METSMDRRLLEELIRDQERLLGIITENLAKLRRLAGHASGPPVTSSSQADELRRSMETQRQEIWAKAEKAKQQAMAQAQQMSGSMPGSMGLMGGMGMMGRMPSTPVGPTAQRLSRSDKTEGE